MKVECPECTAVQEPTWVRADAQGALQVKCGACGVVSSMSGAELRPPEPPLEPGEKAVECPKCLHRQRNPDACDRCGLVFARWDPEKASAPTDEAAIALWGTVDAAWQDEAKHKAFTDYCAAMGLYGYAAQQYGRARADEARRPRAVSEIERLATIAQVALAASQPKNSVAKVKRIKTLLLVVTFVLCALMLVVVASRLM